MSVAIGVTSGTADKIELISVGATVSMDVVVTQIDKDNGAPPVITTVRTNTGVAAAATTKVTTDAATNHEAVISYLSARNTHASATFTVDPQLTLGAGTARKLLAGPISLAPSECLLFDGREWKVYDAVGGVKVSLAAALSVTVLTSGAGSTFTTPVGCRAIRVRCVGGGGAGGGGATAASSGAQGGGGGSGGYTEKLFSPPSATYTYTIGAGGTAGTAGNNAGNNGADTTFGSLTAKGATGGSGMAAATTTTAFVLGGAGGVAGSGGDINMVGQPGYPGIHGTTAATGKSGDGAPSAIAGGAIGVIAQGTGVSATANTGAGGSGGCTLSAGSATAGGAGGSGVVIIECFF